MDFSKVLFVFAILYKVFTINVSAYSPSDSLKKIIFSKSNDTLKINQLTNYAETLNSNGDFEYAIHLSHKALELSSKVKYHKGILETYYLIGRIYYAKQDFKKAISYFIQAIKISNENERYKSLCKFYNAIGNIATINGDYNAAIYYYIETLKFCNSSKDNNLPAKVKLNIGVVYNRLHEDKKALQSYYQALKLALLNKDTITIASCYTNIGSQFVETQNNILGLGYLLMANHLYTLLHINESNYNFRLNYYNIGSTYRQLKLYSKSIYYLKKCLIYAEANNDVETRIYVYQDLAAIYTEKKDLKKAIEYYTYCLDLGKENSINAHKEIITACYYALANIYYSLKDYSNSSYYYKQYAEIINLKAAHQNASEVNEIENNYINQLKTKAFVSQQAKNELETKYKILKRDYIIYLTCILCIILIGIFFVIYRQRKIIHERKQLRLEQKLLRTQMNPHFIFNSLDTIQSLIASGKTNESINYLSHFSIATRQILENSRHDYITIEEEEKTLVTYLSLQQLLVKNGFDFSIYISTEIDKENTMVPPMLAQPFVENAIKHGLVKSNKRGEISIRFYTENDKLFLEIIDNGIGLIEAIKNKKNNHNSIATAITNERLQSLNRYKKNHIQFEELKDKAGISLGTKVFFELPYIS